ncbi:hypothetical protein H4S07_005768, partial [Coemansia furcata]
GDNEVELLELDVLKPLNQAFKLAVVDGEEARESVIDETKSELLEWSSVNVVVVEAEFLLVDEADKISDVVVVDPVEATAVVVVVMVVAVVKPELVLSVVVLDMDNGLVSNRIGEVDDLSDSGDPVCVTDVVDWVDNEDVEMREVPGAELAALDVEMVASSESQIPPPSCRGAVDVDDDADVVVVVESLDTAMVDVVEDVCTGRRPSSLRVEDSAAERGLGLSKSVWIDISIVRVWLVLNNLADEVCVLLVEERNDEREISALGLGAVDVLNVGSSASGVLDDVVEWDFVNFLEV